MLLGCIVLGTLYMKEPKNAEICICACASVAMYCQGKEHKQCNGRNPHVVRNYKRLWCAA